MAKRLNLVGLLMRKRRRSLQNRLRVNRCLRHVLASDLTADFVSETSPVQGRRMPAEVRPAYS